MTDSMTPDDLRPDQDSIAEATLRALTGRVDEEAARSFLTSAAEGVPAAIGATVSLKIAIWGKLYVDPDGQPWKYDVTVWGGPAYVGDSVGFMYTAYDSWDAFFANVTSCHVQAIDVGGGILQVNWFISNGTPVGQFNGVAGGVGLVEGGGSGKWERK